MDARSIVNNGKWLFQRLVLVAILGVLIYFSIYAMLYVVLAIQPLVEFLFGPSIGSLRG
jgi:hypothetical protein